LNVSTQDNRGPLLASSLKILDLHMFLKLMKANQCGFLLSDKFNKFNVTLWQIVLILFLNEHLYISCRIHNHTLILVRKIKTGGLTRLRSLIKAEIPAPI
jgi:hypothetical protein